MGGSERPGTGLCCLPGGLTSANSIQKEQLLAGDGTSDPERRNSRALWLGSQLSRVISWIFSNLTCDSSLTYTGVWLSSEPGQGAADSREQPSLYFRSIPIFISCGPWILYTLWLNVLGEIIFPCTAGSLWGHTVCCFQNQSWTDTLLRWIYLETSVPSVPLRGGGSSQARPDGISARSQLRGAGREVGSWWGEREAQFMGEDQSREGKREPWDKNSMCVNSCPQPCPPSLMISPMTCVWL